MGISSLTSTINDIIEKGKHSEILHLEASSVRGSRLRAEDRMLINFGSCSYLGLEFDERLRQASQKAIEDYGTQFSASRAYVSCGLYADLEKKFELITDHHVVITPTTTLGHISVIPTLISENDAVILDHQVHSSVQGAVELLKPRGIHVEIIRHNRVDMLEERVKTLSEKYEQIWYMADGVYSMFGDKTPVLEIEDLLERYPKLRFYADDAHGFGSYGDKGQGYVLHTLPKHPRMIVALSMAKAFASGGAVFCFPDEKEASLVRNCGGPMITSGPIQPAVLGASCAAADLFLSPAYALMREDLQEKIRFCNDLLSSYGLPMTRINDTPIFFLACGLPKVGYNLVKRMNKAGYLTNLGIFPAVPMRNTGLRFTLNRLLDHQDIERFVENLALHHKAALAEEGVELDSLYKAFKMKAPRHKFTKDVFERIEGIARLELEHFTSIHQLDAQEWDRTHTRHGLHKAGALAMFESISTGHILGKEKWDWDYLIVRDERHRIVLSTFLTTALYKDDMLASEEVSAQIELERKENRYYMCTRTLALGCPLTTGQHLYIDEKHPRADAALDIFMSKVQKLRETRGAQNILLREFYSEQQQMEVLREEHGFIKESFLDDHSIDLSDIADIEAYIQQLSYKKRRHVRSRILKFKNRFEIELKSELRTERVMQYYRLYLKFKLRKLTLNTFPLPFKLFEEVVESDAWRIIEVRNKESQELCAVIFNHLVDGLYDMAFIAIDHDQEGPSAYRQALFASLEDAIALGASQCQMGFTAETEKRNLGAEAISSLAYIQMDEHFSAQYIAQLESATL